MEVRLRIFLICAYIGLILKCMCFGNVVKIVSILTSLHDLVSVGDLSKPANTQGGIGKLHI